MSRITVYLLDPSDRPYYQAQWVLPGTTRRKSKSLKTKDPVKAEQMRADLEYELNNGLVASKNNMTWTEFTEKYLEDRYADRSAQSQTKIRSLFSKFASLNRPKLLLDVTEEMIAEYARHLRRKKFKATTIQTHLAHLSSAMRWAQRNRLINQAPNVEPVSVPKKRSVRSLDAEEFAKLKQSLPADWQVFACAAWLTGMRRNELFYLEWSQGDGSRPYIDWKRNRIEIPAEANKSGQDQWVPIHPDLKLLLWESRKEKGRIFTLSESPREVSRKFSRLAQSAGVKATLHDLRRSFGTRYARVVPAQVLQKLMRHADIKTTLEFYVDLDSALEEAILKA